MFPTGSVEPELGPKSFSDLAVEAKMVTQSKRSSVAKAVKRTATRVLAGGTRRALYCIESAYSAAACDCTVSVCDELRTKGVPRHASGDDAHDVMTLIATGAADAVEVAEGGAESKVHEALPAEADDPERHVTHVDADAAPMAVEDVPSGQSVHVLLPGDATYEPGAHVAHSEAPAALFAVPGAQSVHAPVLLRYVPATHAGAAVTVMMIAGAHMSFPSHATSLYEPLGT